MWQDEPKEDWRKSTPRSPAEGSKGQFKEVDRNQRYSRDRKFRVINEFAEATKGKYKPTKKKKTNQEKICERMNLYYYCTTTTCWLALLIFEMYKIVATLADFLICTILNWYSVFNQNLNNTSKILVYRVHTLQPTTKEPEKKEIKVKYILIHLNFFNGNSLFT